LAKWFTGTADACLRIPPAAQWLCGAASRCDELPAQTRDVFWECLAQRDALGSITNAQMPSGTTHDSTISLSPNQACRPDIVIEEATMPNETVGQPVEYAAWIAVDWGDEKHAWALQAANSDVIEQGVMENKPEVVDVWVADLMERFGQCQIAVAFEQTRGTLASMLGKYPHLVLYPIHPTSLARYREAFTPSGAKDDPPDALLLLDLVRRHGEKLRRWEPDTAATRTIQWLTEDRRTLVDEKTRQTARLEARLKSYFPQITRWFDKNLDSPLAGDLLRRWPTLPELQKAGPAVVRRFLHKHNSRNNERIEQLLKQIREAVPATNDPAIIQAGVLMVHNLVQLIATLHQQIAGLDRQLAKLFAEHEDALLYRSFPAAGPVMGPRLLAAMGTRRERYQSATEVQCYSGIAPVTERSGQREWIHFRRACPKFLRQTFHEWAGHTIARSEWARAFYQHQRTKGKDHHAAVRSLAHKWIRILFRCWQDRTLYDEQRYQQALRRRAAPRIPNAPNFAWERASGDFFRFAGSAS
jgi:transposase